MNVLLLTDDLLPGGIARHIIDVANSFHRTDIKIYLSATPGKYLRKLNPDIPFLPINIMEEDSFKKNIFGIIPSYIRLAKYIQKEKIQIIHSHKRYSHFIGKILSMHFNIPLITSYHSLIEGHPKITVFGEFAICCSNAVREIVVQKYGYKKETVETIYTTIRPFREYDALEKKQSLQELGIPTGKRVISSVGQFIPVKDRRTLILAVNELKNFRNISDVVFLLLGYGEQIQYLKELVKTLQLNESIIFVDGAYNVESVFNISEFTILNSIKEGFGIVMLEAASIGKITIGTNVGGIPEFIENNRTGLLVDKQNPKKLADAIQFLLENPGKRKEMEIQAKFKFETLFKFDVMLEKIKRVYNSIIISH